MLFKVKPLFLDRDYPLALIIACILILLAETCWARVPLPPYKGTKITAGWVEYVTIPLLEGARFKAKLDTGAETSSINAEIIAVSRLESALELEDGRRPSLFGKSVVIFSIPDDTGVKKTFERELVRWARIKRKEGGIVERPVVRFSLCIAGETVSGEVNLAQRSHFDYPVLVGRNMLRKRRILVDSGSTFRTTAFACPDEPADVAAGNGAKDSGATN